MMHETDHRARADMARLAREANRVARLILLSDYPDVDVAIERSKLRGLAEELFPERMDFFEMIYEARFDRLIEQFRESED